MFPPKNEPIPSNQLNSGMIPLTIKMLLNCKIENQTIHFQNQQIQLVNVICRTTLIKKEQNQVKVHIFLNDDSAQLRVNYFLKQQQDDPILRMIQLQENDIDYYNSYYYRTIIGVKMYQDSPYYVLHNIQKSDHNELVFHIVKIIQNEIQSRKPIDWEQLRQLPLDKQIQGYISHYRRANIKQMQSKFNCSIQQIKLIMDRLVQRSIVMECFDSETFQIV